MKILYSPNPEESAPVVVPFVEKVAHEIAPEPEPVIEEDVAPKPEPKPVPLPNFDDFLKEKNTTESVSVEPAKVEPVKVEPIKPVEVEEKPVERKSSRNYDGLDDNEVKLFKKVGTEVFPQLKAAYLEGKINKQQVATLTEDVKKAKDARQIPDSYAEHPDAWQLLPEVSQIKQQQQLVGGFHSHWQQQLVNIRKGDKWTDIVMGADGKYYLSQPNDPTPEAEAAMFSYMQHTATQASELNSKLNNIQASFKSTHTTATGKIKEIENALFKVFDDPNSPHKAILKEIGDNVIGANFKSSPLASLTTKALASCRLLYDAYTTLQRDHEELKKQKAIPAGKANPTISDINSGSASTNTATVTFDDFKKELA